jgi:hypothetical protein
MKILTEIPEGFVGRLTNGEAVLYVSETNEELSILVNPTTNIIRELPTQSALARGYWSELPKDWKPKTKAILFESKVTRKWPLKQEPYDPDARDGDNDGIIQEGTPWERPAGTRFIRANGREIAEGLVSADRPRAAKLVDANGKEVDYTPTYDRPGYVGLGPTIGETAGNVTKPKKVEVRLPEPITPSRSKRGRRKVKSSILPSDGTGNEVLSSREFEELVMAHGKKFLPKNFWKMSVTVEDENGKKRVISINRRTEMIPNLADWEFEPRDTKIVTAHLLAKRMRERGVDLNKLAPFSKLLIDENGTVILQGDEIRDVELERSSTFVTVSPDDPLYKELKAEAVASRLIHQWSIGSSMIGTEQLRGIQNAARDHFDLDTDAYDLPSYWDGEYKSIYEQFISAMYDETQRMFSDAGITHLEVYRGFSLDVSSVDKAALERRDTAAAMILYNYFIGTARPDGTGIGSVPFDLRSLSAFSVDPNIAEDFSREDVGLPVVVASRVPVERILCTPGTGLGCLGEREVVVIGSSGAPDVFTIQSAEMERARLRKEVLKELQEAAWQVYDDEVEAENEFDPVKTMNSLPTDFQEYLQGLDNEVREQVLLDIWMENLWADNL